MKYFLISIVFIFLNGCSQRNAFSDFSMSLEEKNLASNTQSAKITSLNGIEGIFSTIYLNNVYNDIENNEEMFFLSIYMKNSNIDYNLKLNNKEPISIKKIDKNSKYIDLVNNSKQWNQYFTVKFKKDESRVLNFVFETTKSFKSTLTYQKY